MNKWEYLDWKLYAGFENGNVILTGKPNELTILGGKLNFGDSVRVWTYDLLNKSVVNNKHLSNKSILTKHSVISNSETLIIGESEAGKYFWEHYDYTYNRPGIKGTMRLPSRQIEKLKQYNYNQPNLVIEHNEAYRIDYLNRDYAHKSLIFGSDIEPFQVEVDSRTGSIDIMAIPTNLDLKNFQGVCRIDHNKIFLAGGISNKLNHISDKAYIYNLNTRKVRKAGRMKNIRYTFPVVHCNGFVYCLGGREFGGDNDAIMSYTERCNLQTLEWEELPKLNIKRCTSNAFVISGKVYVAGGYHKAKTRTDIIEVFNEKLFRWESFGIMLTQPLEASLHVVKNQKIFFFGGRTTKGDCKTKEYVDISEGDLGESRRLSCELNFAGCLNKMVYVRGFFFIFGSDGMNKMDIINEQGMKMATNEEFKGNLV